MPKNNDRLLVSTSELRHICNLSFLILKILEPFQGSRDRGGGVLIPQFHWGLFILRPFRALRER
jgi:hypothetical protein